MRAIRKYGANSYRGARWHLAAEEGGTETLCGRELAEGRMESKSFDSLDEYGRLLGGTGYSSEYLCRICKSRHDGPKAAPKMSHMEMFDLMSKAEEAGHEAGTNARPTPMHVVERAHPLGDLLGMSDEDNPITKRYPPVMDGACGFAWIIVRPGTSRFARWLKETGRGRADSYYGGVSIWISAYQQSYERKIAHANAMAAVLRDAGINAHASGRLD